MLEKIKDNPLFVIIATIIVGLGLLLILSNTEGDKPQEEKQEEVAVSEQSDSAQKLEVRNSRPQTASVEIGRLPSAGKVVVEKQLQDSGATTYSAVVRKGDNQTVIVRQVVNDFLSERQQELSAEQRLFMETVLVNKISKSEVIHPGEEVSVEAEVLEEVAKASGDLSEAQLDLWASYL